MPKHRAIPATMATQHPDNAHGPYWERNGDGFVSAQEEIEECVTCFRDLGAEEYMWDWEGKFADEAVIDKLFTRYHNYFKRHAIGKKKFLTFRLPNIWQEKGYSLLRALMVILTSEDFARDIRFHTPPLFEVILPMTERASQLLYIQKSFHALAHFKKNIFNHVRHRNTDMLEMIPLLEGVENQLGAGKLLTTYLEQYRRAFHTRPAYIRPFLARSDPAMISGLVATVLANKVALSDIATVAERTHVPMYPIIGVGSLVFRGGLTPNTIPQFLSQYGGARTVTIQSGFRYDFPRPSVERAIRELNRNLAQTKTERMHTHDRQLLVVIIKKFERAYQETLPHLLPTLQPIFAAVPQRRERRQHIGLLAYPRRLGRVILPRAIGFTGSFYTLGIPPEFIGVGRTLALLSLKERGLLERFYPMLKSDLERAGRFVNKKNLRHLATKHKPWGDIERDIEYIETLLNIHCEPKTNRERNHASRTTTALHSLKKPAALARLFTETGKLRQSLG